MRLLATLLLVGCADGPSVQPAPLEEQVVCNPCSPPPMNVTEEFASDGISQVFHLADVPDAATMQVTITEDGYTSLFKQYDPATGVGDWELDASENGVVFLEYMPAAGANVAVHYEPLNDRDDLPEGDGDGCC